jgi:polar amino acid transport system ATP-binding protein
MHESPSDGTAAIEFCGVSKSFGNHTVLAGLDLRVEAGEKVTLVGPSGSGKTTVLRLAMTLEKPSHGDIRILGRSVVRDDTGTALSPAAERQVRARCGMVFQQFNLFPHMTVLRNMALAPRTVSNVDARAADARAMEYLRMVGLEHKGSAYPSQLSGGQQQRIAIARALVQQPAVLLLDEITSALDPELVGEVLDVVRAVAERTRISLLIVTHEMKFAREISDRIVVFESGKIIEEGTREQIFTNPQVGRTRRFLQSVLDH